MTGGTCSSVGRDLADARTTPLTLELQRRALSTLPLSYFQCYVNRERTELWKRSLDKTEQLLTLGTSKFRTKVHNAGVLLLATRKIHGVLQLQLEIKDILDRIEIIIVFRKITALTF